MKDSPRATALWVSKATKDIVREEINTGAELMRPMSVRDSLDRPVPEWFVWKKTDIRDGDPGKPKKAGDDERARWPKPNTAAG